MDTMTSPETGRPLTFEVRPLTLTFGSHSLTVDMPGWYGKDEDDAIFDKAGQTAYHRGDDDPEGTRWRAA